ncbi:hypothetical protein LJK87_30530 [Paenibacillus sp. P25]|nr:hypothetical protein LJK87_30530 [Paenibacillus sp. P25]
MICREFAEKHPTRPQVFRDGNYPGLIHFILSDDESAIADFISDLHACVAGHLSFEPVIGCGEQVTGFASWKEGYLSSLLAWNLPESGIGLRSTVRPDGKAVLTEDMARIIQRYLERGEMELFSKTVEQELSKAFRVSQVHYVKLIFQLYLLLDSLAYTAGVPLESSEQTLDPSRSGAGAGYGGQGQGVPDPVGRQNPPLVEGLARGIGVFGHGSGQAIYRRKLYVRP